MRANQLVSSIQLIEWHISKSDTSAGFYVLPPFLRVLMDNKINFRQTLRSTLPVLGRYKQGIPVWVWNTQVSIHDAAALANILWFINISYDLSYGLIPLNIY